MKQTRQLDGSSHAPWLACKQALVLAEKVREGELSAAVLVPVCESLSAQLTPMFKAKSRFLHSSWRTLSSVATMGRVRMGLSLETVGRNRIETTKGFPTLAVLAALHDNPVEGLGAGYAISVNFQLYRRTLEANSRALGAPSGLMGAGGALMGHAMPWEEEVFAQEQAWCVQWFQSYVDELTTSRQRLCGLIWERRQALCASLDQVQDDMEDVLFGG